MYFYCVKGYIIYEDKYYQLSRMLWRKNE